MSDSLLLVPNTYARCGKERLQIVEVNFRDGRTFSKQVRHAASTFVGAKLKAMLGVGAGGGLGVSPPFPL